MRSDHASSIECVTNMKAGLEWFAAAEGSGTSADLAVHCSKNGHREDKFGISAESACASDVLRMPLTIHEGIVFELVRLMAM